MPLKKASKAKRDKKLTTAEWPLKIQMFTNNEQLVLRDASGNLTGKLTALGEQVNVIAHPFKFHDKKMKGVFYNL